MFDATNPEFSDNFDRSESVPSGDQPAWAPERVQSSHDRPGDLDAEADGPPPPGHRETDDVPVEEQIDRVSIPVSEVREETLTYLWPGRIPSGAITILAGDGGVGKSLLTAAMAAAVTAGVPMPGWTASADDLGEAILLGAEDPAGPVLRPRLSAAGADLDRVRILKPPIHEGYQLRDLETLRRAILECQCPRLLVIDPVTAYLGAVDDAGNARLRRLLDPLADLALRHGLAIVLVHHLAKGKRRRAGQMLLGSGAYRNVARAVHLMVPDPGDPDRRLLLAEKMNLGRLPEGLACRIVQAPAAPAPRLGWDPEPVSESVEEILSRGADRAGSGWEAGANTWLLGHLSQGPVWSTEIFELGGSRSLSRGQLKRLKEKLGIHSRMTGDRWYWCLRPDDPPPSRSVLP